MTVSNGQLGNENSFNVAFMSRSQDTNTVGIVSLDNLDPSSLAVIGNLQKYINQIAASLGVANEDDATRNDYSSEVYITNGEDRKVAIGNLDAALNLLDVYVKAGARDLIHYASDAAYVLDHPVLDGGEVYYNTTEGKGRIYDAVNSIWKYIGSKGNVYLDDAAWVAENGTPEGGEIYYATSISKMRYYDLGAGAWTNFSKKFLLYSSDANFVSENGAASQGDKYWNGTLNQIRFYDGTKWISIGQLFLRYASDAAFEVDHGSPIGGEKYYNTTNGEARYYDAVQALWRPIGQQIVGIHENIGVGDGATTDFNITNLPLSDGSIVVYGNGRKYDVDDYTFSTPTITFDTAPEIGIKIEVWYLSEGNPASPVVSAGTNNLYYHTVSAGEITAKKFTLTSAPSEITKVDARYVGIGPDLHYGIDFNIINTNEFNWNALSLDGFIQENDIIKIQYFN